MSEGIKAAQIDTFRLGKDKDGRVKLTDVQREYIRKMKGKVPKTTLAAEFGVSRRLIDFIQEPALLKKNKELEKKRGGWRTYYDKEKRREVMRRHREKKRIALTQLTQKEATAATDTEGGEDCA